MYDYDLVLSERKSISRASSRSKRKVKRIRISSDSNEEIDEIPDTDQGKDWIPNNLSTPPRSTKTKHDVNIANTITNDGKVLLDCPLCGNARFKIANGESRKLVRHLENCEGKCIELYLLCICNV